MAEVQRRQREEEERRCVQNEAMWAEEWSGCDGGPNVNGILQTFSRGFLWNQLFPYSCSEQERPDQLQVRRLFPGVTYSVFWLSLDAEYLG